MSAAPGKTAAPLEPTERLLQLLAGKEVTAAVSLAASLGLAEALSAGPLPATALAHRLACDAALLRRVLRVLEREGVVERDAAGDFAVTAVGAMLRQEQLGALAAFVGSPLAWNPWSALPAALRRGTSAFEASLGLPLFEYLELHAEQAQHYHAAIEAFTRHETTALLDRFDFAPFRCLADVGGGRGSLLIEVLRRWPHLHGVLFELPAAAAQAEQALTQAGLRQRCTLIVGDFFQTLPAAAPQTPIDLCVVKHVLHNWPDERALALLGACRAAVGPQGQVLAIEGLLLPGEPADDTAHLDLEMLVWCGRAGERRKPHLRRLLHAAGLRLQRSVALTRAAHLLVCAPHAAAAARGAM